MLIERHHDYVFPVPDGTANATLLQDQSVQLDSDAPFELRRLLVTAGLSGGVTQMRFRDRLRQYTSDALVGFPASFTDLPVWTQERYPALSTIDFDFQNVNGGALNDEQIVFRGVKIGDESVFPPMGAYPDKFSAIPFYKPLRFTLPQDTIQRDNIVPMQPDGDIVIRGVRVKGQVASSAISLLFRDFWGKAYSNLPVPVNATPADATLSGGVDFYPEIYVPRTANFYFDIFRDDTGGTGVFSFTFYGAKIYPR